MPYEDVENIRPMSKKMVEAWLKVYGDAKDVLLGWRRPGTGLTQSTQMKAGLLAPFVDFPVQPQESPVRKKQNVY